MHLLQQISWWKPTQQGLEYASSGVINNLGESLTARGNVHSPNFSFTPGFKVGLGVNLPYDGWDLTAEYTWIRDNHNKDTVSKSNGNISPSVFIGSNLEFQLGMMGQWWFSNDDYHLAVSLGYDQQVWINYGNFIYLIDNGQADLSLHGLTLKFRFDF